MPTTHSPLPNFLANKLSAIQRLAREHKVTSLEVFGSVVTGQFKATSDIDMLVGFMPLEPTDYSQHYFALKHSLEDLLARKVDLLEVDSLDNPYFLKAIEIERTVLYAA
jgi:uncharacterized protein